MVCRNPTKCLTTRDGILEQVPTANVETITMDTLSLASVRQFAETYIQQHHGHELSSIDMIFMNVGQLYFPAPGENITCAKRTAPPDNIEYLFQVNYLGHHLMYQLLQPMLRPNARIVQTSSVASFEPYQSYKVATNLSTLHGCSEPWYDYSKMSSRSYGQSKLAQILWVKALAREQQREQDDDEKNIVYANAYHPGAVATPAMEKVLDSCKADNTTMFAKMIHTLMPGFWSAADGALTGLYLGINPLQASGKYYHPQSQEIINPHSTDEQLQDDLWDFSNQLVQDYLTPITKIPPPKVEKESQPSSSSSREVVSNDYDDNNTTTAARSTTPDVEEHQQNQEEEEELVEPVEAQQQEEKESIVVVVESVADEEKKEETEESPP